jgi:hypothetical protein
VWSGENILLDGHNRLEICRNHHISYKVKTRHFGDRNEAKEWIIRNQVGRRNLNESQRAMLAAWLAPLDRGVNQHTAIAASTQAEVSQRYDISPDSLQRAKKVERHGVLELQKAVIDGEVAVSAAAEIAGLAGEEQRKVLDEGRQAVKAKAKEIRAGKASRREPKGDGKETAAALTADPDADGLSDEDRGRYDEIIELWTSHMSTAWTDCNGAVRGAFCRFLKHTTSSKRPIEP